MKRREIFAIPGVAGIAAFAASQAFGSESDAAGLGAPGLISRKALSKETGSKASYELPKNAAKQTKYVASLTALLGLSASQQQQAASIFTVAVNNRFGLHSTLKEVRKSLSAAVKSNDGSGIAQAASQIGTLMTQYVSNGALANCAFYNILTASQQATLNQYQGKTTVSE
jgi:hypothetical protein